MTLQLDVFLEAHGLGNPRLLSMEMDEVRREAGVVRLLEAQMTAREMDLDDTDTNEGAERKLHLDNIKSIIDSSRRRALAS